MNHLKTKLISIVSIAVLAISTFAIIHPSTVRADQFDEQIAALKKKVQDTQALADAKASEVNTLKGKLASIDADISAAQQQLDLTRLEIKHTQAAIDDTNAQLARQQDILRDNLKTIYKQGDISPLEVLASSKNLSDFVSQQQYLDAIKRKVDENINQINELKKQLDSKKDQLSAQSSQQQDVVNKISAKRAEQQSILSQTQGQEAAYQNIIKSDNDKIASLRRQQAAIISSFSSNVHYGGSGGYPWANVQPFPNSYPDDWGMYKRQCVSYTAWKVASTGRNMPYWGGRGNAYQWPGNARAKGIPVDYGTNAKVGDVAISTAGSFGHAMYVESVLGNGKVRVSQYNANWDGNYSVSDVSMSNLYFIHFP